MPLPKRRPEPKRLGIPFNRGGRFWIGTQNLRRSDKILAVLLLLSWVAILLGYFWPSRNRFDGNLLVQEMSFTYAGEQDRLFLNSIQKLKGLDLKGSQPKPITLSGTFYSPDPAINQKLKKGKLTVQLPYANSRLIFKPIKQKESNSSSLSILNLRVEPETQVNQLTFTPKTAQLSFCMQSSSMDLAACLDPDSHFNNQPIAPNAPTIGKLSLQFGEKPLEVTLVRIKSPELGNEEQDQLTFQFIPSENVGDEIELDMFAPTKLEISLPAISKIPPEEVSKWFWGGFDVRDVRFRQFLRNYTNVKDEFDLSTILEGKVRMGNQVLDLQQDQFLVVPPNEPGINNLLFIRVNPQSPQGIRTSFSGSSQSIGAGFYRQSPVQEIKLNWVSRFPQEAINSVLAFIGALTGILLPRLIPEQDDDDTNTESNKISQK